MNTDKDYIYTIIYRYLTGQITDEESVILESWKSEYAENRIAFDDIVGLWHKTGNFQFPVKIDTGRALSEVHGKSGIREQKSFSLTFIRQIAAILILSVLFSGLYSYFFSGKANDSDYYEEVHAAYGTRTNVGLPDGSVVFLNSGSSLRFPGRLGQTVRKVELKGEGYFKVAEDAKRPFIVDVGKLSVEALGTEFNVNAYEPESQIDVILIQGKVVVRTGDDKKSGSDLILVPNQLAHFDAVANSLLEETVREPDKYTGWTEGKIIFRDDPIREVMRRMENWYNVDIQLKDQGLMNYRFTGTFVDEALEEILNAFSLTSPLHYEIVPAVKNEEGIYSKRKINLRTR